MDLGCLQLLVHRWLVQPLVHRWLVQPLVHRWLVQPLVHRWSVQPLVHRGSVQPLVHRWLVQPLVHRVSVQPLVPRWLVQPLVHRWLVQPLVHRWLVQLISRLYNGSWGKKVTSKNFLFKLFLAIINNVLIYQVPVVLTCPNKTVPTSLLGKKRRKTGGLWEINWYWYLCMHLAWDSLTVIKKNVCRFLWIKSVNNSIKH